MKLLQVPTAWEPGSSQFKHWCAQWFGPDADDVYLMRAVHELLATAHECKPPQGYDAHQLQHCAIAVSDLLAAERERMAELMERQHTWISNTAAANLIRSA